MDGSSDRSVAANAPAGGDRMSLRRWFAAYAAWLLVAGGVFAALVAGQGWSWRQWSADPAGAFAAVDSVTKLLGFTLYLSLCCTFLPLPTGWIVAALATREAALTGGLTGTVLLVASAGALGSTLANLTDYYLFTAMLRHRRVAAVRDTRTYIAAAKWFARGPFFIVLVFSFVPIPMDVVRMLAATYRYNRAGFAAANFVGRFIRYGVIAFVTYFWDLGWIAPVALLVLAAVIGAGKLGIGLARRLRPAPTGQVVQAPEHDD